MQNERYAVSTESGSDLVTILAISILAIGGDPVATALGTDLILKLGHTAQSKSLTPKRFVLKLGLVI